MRKKDISSIKGPYKISENVGSYDPEALKLREQNKKNIPSDQLRRTNPGIVGPRITKDTDK
jgi:hypothetical protein